MLDCERYDCTIVRRYTSVFHIFLCCLFTILHTGIRNKTDVLRALTQIQLKI